jgi:hypothetical protein
MSAWTVPTVSWVAECLVVSEDDRVVVDVDDAGAGLHRAGDLVHVGRRRDAGAQVDELVDALLGHVANGAHQEAAVGPHQVTLLGMGGYHLLGRLAVGGEVVLASQPVVVHPSGGWGVHVDDVPSLLHDRDHMYGRHKTHGGRELRPLCATAV